LHFDPNLTAIAIVFSVALLCGLLLMRFKQPAIIGYIVAGVILGPSGFQIIEETEAAKTLAELGVLLLLFLIGMELSLRAFKTVYKLASVIVLVQVVFSILVTSIIGIAMSWDWQQGILLGFVLAVSSTAVTVKVLADRGELRTHFGRITVGILIAIRSLDNTQNNWCYYFRDNYSSILIEAGEDTASLSASPSFWCGQRSGSNCSFSVLWHLCNHFRLNWFVDSFWKFFGRSNRG
jgi:hypothetical protein